VLVPPQSKAKARLSPNIADCRIASFGDAVEFSTIKGECGTRKDSDTRVDHCGVTWQISRIGMFAIPPSWLAAADFLSIPVPQLQISTTPPLHRDLDRAVISLVRRTLGHEDPITGDQFSSDLGD
jgi:hypothetical protein